MLELSCQVWDFAFILLPKNLFCDYPSRKNLGRIANFGEVVRMSTAALVQQSVMNFGILMIQGLVNSFGTTVMAAFTVPFIIVKLSCQLI